MSYDDDREIIDAALAKNVAAVPTVGELLAIIDHLEREIERLNALLDDPCSTCGGSGWIESRRGESGYCGDCERLIVR